MNALSFGNYSVRRSKCRKRDFFNSCQELSKGHAATIIEGVKVNKLHSWQLSTAQALELQDRLAKHVSRNSQVTAPRSIADVDIAAGGNLKPERTTLTSEASYYWKTTWVI